MKKRIKVLIVSRGPWRDDNNSGNTLTNLFDGWEKADIAQIYCSAQKPDNSICSRYYQISDKMLVQSILGRKPAGRSFEIAKGDLSEDVDQNTYNDSSEKRLYDFARMNKLPLFFLIRELLWIFGNWKTRQLNKFLDDFAPDVIFAPLFDSHYTCNLTKFVANGTHKRVATFIAEDIYTYRQISYSPIYWINRFFLRRNIRLFIDKCSDIFIMAPKQLQEYSSIFARECKLLYKCGKFDESTHKSRSVNCPVRIVYAGNVYSGRWATLAKIGQALRNINKNGLRAELYIYTQNAISAKMRASLEIKDSVFLMGGIPFSEVESVLSEADILVHVESFELKSRLETRLSFSTKLVDYFESGRCIFAVGWDEAASIDYLVQNDAAVVVTRISDIEENLKELIDNPQLIQEYGQKAWDCGKRNHQIDNVKQEFWANLETLSDVHSTLGDK